MTDHLNVYLDGILAGRLAQASGGALSFSYDDLYLCLLYTSPSPRDGLLSRMPSSA